MTLQLIALCFDANDPPGLARFWSGVLGWETVHLPDDGRAILPSDDTGFRIEFFPTQEPKVGPNQMHFDLTSTSLEDQQETVARALGLGAGRALLHRAESWAPYRAYAVQHLWAVGDHAVNFLPVEETA